jgi:hypothetical protein
MSTESIQELINAEAKKLAATYNTVQIEEGESMYKLGAKLFVRTVTYHYTGRVSFLSEKEIVLSDAAWVASSGRFAEALETGELSEVEPYPGACSINRDVIVDCSPWNHELPRGTK